MTSISEPSSSQADLWAFQEDNATLEALLRAAIYKLVDFARVIVMRTASDFDRPYNAEVSRRADVLPVPATYEIGQELLTKNARASNSLPRSTSFTQSREPSSRQLPISTWLVGR